ncbi:L,D-transpeptidase [Halochromatium roseum]|uniref:L,D-transpeptidase n=1 Tax=Halochromatium roseum TaxID=391920 RepID=UPI0019124958|nr:L,D-transpeptidase [Halochromatium roseum]MBK5942000.1 hypothetical protein [Halochromatium roseum]
MYNVVILACVWLLLLAGCASQPYPPLPSDVPRLSADGGASQSVPRSALDKGDLSASAEASTAGARAREQQSAVAASASAPVSQVVNPLPPDPASLASAEKRQLDIRLAEQRFNYFEDDQLVWTGPISSGTPEHPTPRGKYLVQSKDINKRSGSYTNFFDRPTPMPYSLQFTGPYFVHEGYVTGQPESHGCVRLRHEDARFVYSRMRVGDRIVVAD